MIHGQLRRRHLILAIVAYSFGNLLFPPLRFPQFTAFLFFAGEQLGIDGVPIHGLFL